jgi:hypothetical protein
VCVQDQGCPSRAVCGSERVSLGVRGRVMAGMPKSWGGVPTPRSLFSFCLNR